MTKTWFNDFFPSEVITAVSDRSVDFTLEAGQTDLTSLQKAYLTSLTGIPIQQIINIRQVHGAKIIQAQEAMNARMLPLEVDGLITNSPQIPIAVRTADCLPVFIYDPKQKCIGLVHAGWRGSEKKIVVQAIKRMNELWYCQPQDLLVAFGPAIRSCCYEVGKDFKRIFPGAIIVKRGHFYLDLILLNKQQLTGEGVKQENMYDCEVCTCCHHEFFSYRREGDATGRHISVIVLKK